MYKTWRARDESEAPILDKPECCRRCPFYTHPMVPNHGPDNAEIMLVGDSPWRDEVRTGLPFQGIAGEILDVLLDTARIDRRDVYVANAVRCKPDQLNQAYPAGVVETCTKNFLFPDVKRIKPKIVVPMGNTALGAITNVRGITNARGIVQTIKWMGLQLNVLPTFHPSFINRNPAYAPYCVQDYEAAKYFVQNGAAPGVNNDLEYKAVVSERDFEEFFAVAEVSKVFSWDLETTGLDWQKDEVLCMSFSFAPKKAYVLMAYQFPVKKQLVRESAFWRKSVIKRLYDLLYSAQPKFFHNGKFDLRMLYSFFRRLGLPPIEPRKIRWYDTQAMYALIDENTKRSLKEIAKLHTDLRYTKEELAVVKSGQLKKLPLDKVVHYAGKDADATRRLGLLFRKQLLEQDLWHLLEGRPYSDMDVANELFDMEIFGAPIDREEITSLEKLLAFKLEQFRKRMIRYANIEIAKSFGGKPLPKKFNPRSVPQLRDVMFKRIGFPAPDVRTPKGEVSTGKAVINTLIEQHPDNRFMRALKFYRAYDAIFKTFVKGFRVKLDPNGRLHPDFAFTSTVSGRVVCYRPNLANIPRDAEIQQGIFISIRSLFVAPEGHRIGYADYSQIEFKAAAVLSGDEKMIKALFVDRQDFHTLVCRALYPGYRKTEKRMAELQAYAPRIEAADFDERLAVELLKESRFSKNEIRKLSHASLQEYAKKALEELLKSCDVILKTGRTRSKNFNFGRIYGGQRATLAKALGLQPDDPAVDEFIDRLAEEYPEFERYLTEVPEMAIREGYLRSAYGRIRHFPATLDPVVAASQGRQGGNFGPQSGAAYVMRAALVRIGLAFRKQGLRARNFNIVYDSNINQHPNEEERAVATIVAKEMLKPVPELGNYVFSMEMGNGRSWKEAEKNAVRIFDKETALKYINSL